MITTPLTSLPEGLIVRKFRERNRYITQFGINLHYGTSTCKTEQFCFRPSLSGEIECELLDTLCQSQISESRNNYQTGVSHIMLVAPCLDIAETCKLITTQGYNSLSLFHF